MKYWYAPLRPEPGNIFSTPDHVNARAADPLYVGEITKAAYDRIMFERTMGSEDLDEFGLPVYSSDEYDI